MESLKFDSVVKDDEICEIDLESYRINDFNIVIFGGAGDLSTRKLIPSLYNLYINAYMKDNFNIIGFGLPEMDNDAYQDVVRKSIKTFAAKEYNEEKVEAFVAKFSYISSGFDDEVKFKETFKLLKSKKMAKEHNVFYFAVPPTFSPTIIENLGKLREKTEFYCKLKLVMEKPFGVDKKSAINLNEKVHEYFEENQIYRIDHYLGKETVQNILYFRFGNSILEPLWNRQYIDHVQITVSEDIGIEHRGKFYEKAGVVRDIIQNHMMQLISLVAMEPPVGFTADFVRDEKVKVLRTIRRMTKADVDENTVSGQYIYGLLENKEALGYREEKDVNPDSNTATYIAGKFFIDNWRWAGVPFYVRAGKRLKRKVTEIYIEFKQLPLKLMRDNCSDIKSNSLVLKIQPEEEIIVNIGIKQPGVGNILRGSGMKFNYKDSFEEAHKLDAYERLLIDCINSDLTLFARQDGIEQMWEIVDPIINRWSEISQAPASYRAGSWGPLEAFKMIEKDGRKWRYGDEK